MIKVAPSILSADFSKLGAEVEDIRLGGADYVHFDVMDGCFVPNISIGIPVLKSLRKATDMLIDVHLMITDPMKYIDNFADFGADIISFHIESESDTAAVIDRIHERGLKAAVALRPATPVESVFKYLSDVDMILVMTVEPGFGGQSFIPETLDKVRAVRNKITELGLDVNVQVDGGINADTAAAVRAAGANVLVSGSYLFAAADMAAAADSLREDR